MEFLSPILGRDTESLEWGSILPIAETQEERLGGFSKVTKVRFHEMHITPHLKVNQKVALKVSTFDVDDEVDKEGILEMFQKEIEVLKIMRELDDDHLIKFVTSFSLPGDIFIVFPWAEAGNLRDLWFREDGGQRMSPSRILEQLRGVFNGISKIHAKDCVHGDLKPENLLLFPEPGTSPLGTRLQIVVADFGLATVYENPTAVRRVNQQFTKTVWRTPDYEAPEFEDSHPQDIVRSRSFDIWQMGCISLEFLIWWHGGCTGLSDFHNKIPNEKFWKETSDDASLSRVDRRGVHPVVLEAMQKMRASVYFWNSKQGAFLSYIQEQLIVAENNGKKRPESSKVVERIDQILEGFEGLEVEMLQVVRGRSRKGWNVGKRLFKGVTSFSLKILLFLYRVISGGKYGLFDSNLGFPCAC
ncbi:uncharacterized protein PV07_05779 [Cladophialophora immunda]|uniref:Protein kinase domain-containing protein n=1 Tax=Cladophialophora immunda TaxID=569365 RepID=A0A0D2CFZ2_9EURO|nr:uncharacterized protein PV07_05779 [Cladophialophora immunda]KIW29998.1 hypothetical protein PV07_05779 [Cladophialophora immunda]